jgi:lantibiotic modifying enzyme
MLQWSFASQGGRAWIGAVPIWEKERVKVDVVGYDLYSGLSGIGVFFAALYRITGIERYREVVLEIFASIACERERCSAAEQDRFGLGAGTGAGSWIYGSLVSAKLVGDSTVDEIWRRSVQELGQSRPAPAIDVVDGIAGLLLALLAVHEATADASVLVTARRLGDELCEFVLSLGNIRSGGQLGRLTGFGFAHGLGGVVFALIRLFSVCGGTRRLQACKRALRILEEGYDRRRGNWPDHRFAEGDGRRWIADDWCHGALGLRMARLTSRGIQEIWSNADQDAWQARGRRYSRKHFDHLCCGETGVIEFLSVELHASGEEHLGAAVSDRVNRICKRIAEGHSLKFPGAPAALAPGLFNGCAGVGYSLLRAAEPKALPRVLMFESPPQPL